MFVKVELTDKSTDNYLVNTDKIVIAYEKEDSYHVEFFDGIVLRTITITEESFRTLVGFLFREKKNQSRTPNIIVSGQRPYRPYRRYNRYSDDAKGEQASE